MKSDIDALQNDIANHSVSLTAVLQKAIVLANKQGDAKFMAWARRELSGYTKRTRRLATAA